MNDIEIPLGKRSRQYRFFEILPGFISYGAIVLLVILSLLSPILAAAYLLIIIVTTFIKSIGITGRTIQGYNRLKKAQTVDWQARLEDLPTAQTSTKSLPKTDSRQWASKIHQLNLEKVQQNPENYPKLKDIYNAVIIPTYNEGLQILEPTLQAILHSSFPAKKVILVMAYEARDGAQSEEAVLALVKKHKGKFKDIFAVKHPLTPREVRGKGGNATYAATILQGWLKQKGIASSDVIVTTLDSDNRPHKDYFSYVTYEYIVHENRLRLAFQPITLFLNNIWDVPAPMRVLATGNSFWNIISSMRPHSLRNFSSHSQGMEALEQMNFWSVRTVVEDGHHYWRSYFHFNGNYSVIPIYIPIFHDAVLSHSYLKTFRAQFVQLQRWAYGVSDIPYIAVRVFSKKRTVPFWSGVTHFSRLLDSHVSWSTASILVAVGGWVPLFLNQEAARSIIVHELPEVISRIQQIAMIGLLIMVFLAFKMLPPRPERYKRHRNILMLLQWLLMPVTAILYGSLAAYNSQTRLMLGKYLDKFTVTDKVTKS